MQYEDVLKLGEKIVDEFGLDKSCDTLGRWMAHYIAEKMADVEAATGEEIEKKKFACAEVIFHFWGHRNELQGTMQPFKELESVFDALLTLAPDDNAPRYFRSIRVAAEEDGNSSESAEWLELASGIDDTARILIRYCLAAAAGASSDKSKEWIALADAVGKGDDLDLKIVKNLIKDKETLAPATSESLDPEKLKIMIGKLDDFTSLAKRLSSHFAELLGEVEAES